MSQDHKARFNWRGFTSVTTALFFLGLACTGTVLFFMPPGRIANWTGWTCAGLTKHQWGGLHIWFGILFVVASLGHLFFNWKPLVNYLKDRTRQHFALRWEWALSLGLFCLITVGTLKETGPFARVMAWQETIKASYDRLPAQAPIPHAELLTLDELADKVEGVDAAALEANLKAKGIALNASDETLGQVAERLGKTPSQIYQLAIGEAAAPHGRGQGQGQGAGRGGHGGGVQRFGQMTLKDYCEQTGLDLATATEQLEQAGCTVSDTMVMRDIAVSAGVHPSELRGLLE